MHIVCPNCTTSYAIDPAQLGPDGRSVRCSRCKDTWHVHPADAVLMADAETGSPSREPHAGRDHADDANAWQHDDTPVVESPSISTAVEDDHRLGLQRRFGLPAGFPPQLRATLAPLSQRLAALPRLPAVALPALVRRYATLPAACVAMAALALALVVWRADVVRLMPQTAAFFRAVGLEVNLRGLRIDNVVVTAEDIDGKRGFVIEGVVTVASAGPAQVPRLRFIVSDGHGAEIYAWTSVLEQAIAQPGERLPFRTRLASPPAEAREIAVRFFSRRDIGA